MSFLGKLFGSKPDPVLYSPVKGEAILNDQIPDPTFAEGILGPTFAVDPKEGLIKAPCDGTITQIFRTGHAVTLTSKDGVEILIHVGINTVDLKGEGFKPLVKDNEEVKKGSPLIEFDIDLIKEKGFSTIVPIVVCNPTDFESVTFIKPSTVDNQSQICTFKNKK